ncbi:hypothetical protein BZA77DRAFT_295066 [Pyronema omphalodes]|nr:hypothetical protein BZA77DRAFT_295066 [Pyronema omphalodes]
MDQYPGDIPIDPALLELEEAEEPQDGQQDVQQGLVLNNTGVVQDYSAPIQHYDHFGVAGLAPYYSGSDQWMPQVNYLNEPYPASYNPPYSNYYWNAPYNVYSGNPLYATPMAPATPHDPAFQTAAMDPTIDADANEAPNHSTAIVNLTGDAPPHPAAIGADAPLTPNTGVQTSLFSGTGSNNFGLPPVPANSTQSIQPTQAAIPATPSAPAPQPATSTPSTGTTVTATPSMTPRALGYPMQKDCMVKCGLPLEGLLSWKDLPESEQQAAIDRLMEIVPHTSRDFAAYHLKTQMGKYKDEKKRQIKKMEKRHKAAASKAEKGTGEGRNDSAAEASAGTFAEATDNGGVQSQTTANQAPQRSVASGISTPGIATPGLVTSGGILATQASQMNVTGQAPHVATANHSSRPPNVFAGFKNQTLATPAASPASKQTQTAAAAAAAAAATPTPAPRRRGRPPGSKNRPPMPTPPSVIQSAVASAPVQATSSPAVPSPVQLSPALSAPSTPAQVAGPSSPLAEPAQAPVEQAQSLINPEQSAVNPAQSAVNPAESAVNPAQSTVDQAQSPVAQARDQANNSTYVATPPTRGRPPIYGPPLPKYFRFKRPVDCDAAAQQAPAAPKAQQQPTAMSNENQSLQAQQNDSALLASLASAIFASDAGNTSQSMATTSWTAINTPQQAVTPQQLDEMHPPTASLSTDAPAIQEESVDTPMEGQLMVATNNPPIAADNAGQSNVATYEMGMDVDNELDVKVKVEEDSGDEGRAKRRKLNDEASGHA